MHTPVNYITTWFYKESKEEASFYPQLGQKGSSSLVHSIYMQIQVPFFVTFKHYNPDAQFIFFTNLNQKELPDYLIRLFHKLNVEVVTLPYTCKPPKDWYPAWQNQFYLYDILKYMDGRMLENDTLLISDADCLCRTPLNTLFEVLFMNSLPTEHTPSTVLHFPRWKRYTSRATARRQQALSRIMEGSSLPYAKI